MRRRRSELSVPASNWKMIEKALGSEADIAFLDLEDSVAPAEKGAARENVVRAISELDWRGKPRAFRVNGLESGHFYRDLVEILDEVVAKVDLVILPKAESAVDVLKLAAVLKQIEPKGKTLGIEVQIESARGLLNAASIAAANPRIEALIFGPGDYAASVGMPSASIGVRDEWDDHYGGDRWHFALQSVLVAARASQRDVIDGPFANFRDLDGFRGSCLKARALGYDGKWCIHPSQIPIANEVFTPSEDEVRRALEVVDAYEEANRLGLGAVSIDDKMIDAASVKMAERTLGKASDQPLSS
jgi:citrate lyase beta subunit